MNDQKTILDVELTKLKIKDRILLQNTSFQIKEGETVLLLGPNGSGKSTLIRSLIGCQRSSDVEFDAKVKFNGKECTDLSTISEQVGYSEQSEDKGEYYFSGLSSVMLKCFPYYRRGYAGKKDVKEEAKRLFDYFNSKQNGSNKRSLQIRGTSNLSGGERKILSIIAALSRINSPLFILDEPLNNLDSSTMSDLLNLIEKKNTKSTFLVITHCHLFKNPSQVFEIKNTKIENVTKEYKPFNCLESLCSGN